MNKKVIIYQDLQGKEIYRDWECDFIPTKGHFIRFIDMDEKLCNLMPHERKLEYEVIKITLSVPSVMMVTVA